MKTILIIEDETAVRENLRDILRLEGFKVHEACNGFNGVAMARQVLPDLILCDVSMPGADGHAVLTALKDQPATSRIPFVFLTARGEHTDVRRGMNLGADDYLIKPVDIDDLVNAVHARLLRATEHLSAAPTAHLPESPAELQALGMTPREAEILFWITQGKSNPEIAIILEMRLVTVKKHVQNVLQKLGVENRTAALRVVTERLV
ncbi:MAG: response regulator transcription factor [Cephaloticoccus sp.]|nr:response regulator transcription factor [Cephaloticoccus sp.]MCF7760512.1 response regulator transcription factor [Cephaloticoccus sp.]